MSTLMSRFSIPLRRGQGPSIPRDYGLPVSTTALTRFFIRHALVEGVVISAASLLLLPIISLVLTDMEAGWYNHAIQGWSPIMVLLVLMYTAIDARMADSAVKLGATWSRSIIAATSAGIARCLAMSPFVAAWIITRWWTWGRFPEKFGSTALLAPSLTWIISAITLSLAILAATIAKRTWGGSFLLLFLPLYSAAFVVHGLAESGPHAALARVISVFLPTPTALSIPWNNNEPIIAGIGWLIVSPALCWLVTRRR